MEMGLDPVFEKRKARGIPTFKEAAAKVHAANQETWRNDKHEWQRKRTLEQFVYPTLGNVSVAEITGPMVRNVLAEIWLSKPETARRVRQRIGAVLDWAYASGYRETEAPMRSITKGLPRQPRSDGHHAAMPYTSIASFLAALRTRETLVLAAQPSRLDFQGMTSPTYHRFADKADAVCPARSLRHLHPADLDGIEEDFMPSITRRQRHRVATLNLGDKGCTGGGASCSAQNTLAAISKAGLLDAFVSFACASPI